MTPEVREEMEKKYRQAVERLFKEAVKEDFSQRGDGDFYAAWKMVKAARAALSQDTQRTNEMPR